MIDINRLNPATYCILVLWLSGSLSTSKIAEIMRIDETAVKAATRDKSNGGVLPKSRQFMTRGERQDLLQYLRHYRMDRGRFDKGDFFTAVPIKREPEEPIEMPDIRTKAGKKRLRELAHEAQIMRNADLKEAAEPQDGGNTRRGVNAYPLEWLYKERLLRDPDDIVVKGELDRFSSEMRRYECGFRLRKYLEEAQLSGFKEINLERAGAASSAVSIPERFVAARSAVEAIRSMMAVREFDSIVSVIQYDEFIWDSVSDQDGRDAIMESIRKALDIVALFIGMMETKAFESRWSTAPAIAKGKTRDEVRESVRTARKIIQEGARQ